ncbi:MAG: hypothetical protein HYR56_04310 [Acidobacteria bacterium]|nr:hypothetical protein [Acidobacteriota bacterium]MBI3421743.1 hypothetical protein [Acidobacteriota bacterium]
MKPILLCVCILWFACAGDSAVALAQETAQKKTPTSAKHRLAVEGDEVWVAVNTIKADKREQFEKWVYEIFWPAGLKLPAKERAAFEHTRVLRPSKANDDGTWTYLYVMDPVIPGAEYDIERLLKRMFDEAKAQEYGRMLEETMAKPQFGYDMKQGRVWRSQ